MLTNLFPPPARAPMRPPAGLALAILACSSALAAQDTDNFPTIGEVVRENPALEALVAPDATIEVLASGFTWTEGPVWSKDGGFLLFSEIPSNSVMRWSDADGLSLYLRPSGYTGVADYGAEPGSNGLLIDPAGNLISCEHGDRRLSIMTPDGGKRTLADRYDGHRFNSPNDVARRSNGDLYFTDPPYGLPDRADDPRRELDFCGVYRWSAADDTITLLTVEFSRPNGIAFSPDEKTLYVAQSDPAAAIWKALPVNDDGSVGEGKVFYDATGAVGKMPGLPDGLKVDGKGNVFATGPGGVYVFAPDATLLGRISTGEAVSNVGWGGDDGSVLYLTSDMYLCRIQTMTKGAGW